MVVHEYNWRGVIVECACGRNFHVNEAELPSFRCPCKKGVSLGPARARRALRAVFADPHWSTAGLEPAQVEATFAARRNRVFWTAGRQEARPANRRRVS